MILHYTRFYRDSSKEESNMQKTNGIMSTRTMVLGAMLTALVVVFQFIGSAIKFGPFSISLVLIPIVIGAALCGPLVGAWLGCVFGIVVFISGDAAWFLSISVPGTIITVMLKGIACGAVAGLVYKLFKNKNKYLAGVAAAIVCPVVNTGVFVIGCLLFFYKEVAEAGAAEEFSNGIAYIFLGMIGANFLVELLINAILSPVVVMLIDLYEKKKV